MNPISGIEYRYGFPIVNSENIRSVLDQLGVRVWPTIRRPVALDHYKSRRLSNDQLEEMYKYAPEVQVEVFEDPEGEPFVGFRAIWPTGNGCMVFTLLPDDLIPIAAEFRHGAGVVSLILPGGVMDGNDPDHAACAKREFEDETGITLKKVVPLDDNGIPLSARGLKQSSCSFLGVLSEPLIINPQKLEKKEFLQIVLISLLEWLKLIESGQVKECASIVATFLALRKLRKLTVINI